MGLADSLKIRNYGLEHMVLSHNFFFKFKFQLFCIFCSCWATFSLISPAYLATYNLSSYFLALLAHYVLGFRPSVLFLSFVLIILHNRGCQSWTIYYLTSSFLFCKISLILQNKSDWSKHKKHPNITVTPNITFLVYPWSKFVFLFCSHKNARGKYARIK